MDYRRIAAFDEMRLVSHPLEELLQLFFGNSSEEAGIGDLVAVQVQDWQHAAIASRIEKLIAVPAGGQRAGLCFAVANDAGHDQIGVVERGAKSVAQRISQLASFMNAAWSFRRNVAGNAAGEAELLEQPLHALRVLADVVVDVGV